MFSLTARFQALQPAAAPPPVLGGAPALLQLGLGAGLAAAAGVQRVLAGLAAVRVRRALKLNSNLFFSRNLDT